MINEYTFDENFHIIGYGIEKYVSNDETYYLAEIGNYPSLIETKTGKIVYQVPYECDYNNEIVLSDDASTILIHFTNGSYELHDVHSGQPPVRIEYDFEQYMFSNHGYINAVDLSFTGKWIAVASWDKGTISILEAESGEKVLSLPIPIQPYSFRIQFYKNKVYITNNNYFIVYPIEGIEDTTSVFSWSLF